LLEISGKRVCQELDKSSYPFYFLTGGTSLRLLLLMRLYVLRPDRCQLQADQTSLAGLFASYCTAMLKFSKNIEEMVAVGATFPVAVGENFKMLISLRT
jgi:hypothetical protein